jgi:hypothetical protein
VAITAAINLDPIAVWFQATLGAPQFPWIIERHGYTLFK